MFTIIIKFIIDAYMVILIHELGHFMVAKYYGVKVYEVNIGGGSPILRFKVFKLNLPVLSGNVIVNKIQIKQLSKIKVFIYFMSGVLNTLLYEFLIGFEISIFHDNIIYLSIIASLFPLCKTDMALFIKYYTKNS